MKQLPTSKNPKGFTLVELLVVIAIIAILAAVGFAIFSNNNKKAQDARRRSDIKAISDALESRYDDTSTTPYQAVDGSWFASGNKPTDPDSTKSYTGIPAAAASSYNVCATLSDNTSFCMKNQRTP